MITVNWLVKVIYLSSLIKINLRITYKQLLKTKRASLYE